MYVLMYKIVYDEYDKILCKYSVIICRYLISVEGAEVLLYKYSLGGGTNDYISIISSPSALLLQLSSIPRTYSTSKLSSDPF